MNELTKLIVLGYDLQIDHTADGFIKVVARKPGRHYEIEAAPGRPSAEHQRIALQVCLLDIVGRVDMDDAQHITING